jgi:hypothetical protein
MLDDTHFEGYVITYPKYVKIYDKEGQVSHVFLWRSKQKTFKCTGTFNNTGTQHKSPEINGKGAGLFMEYKTAGNEAIELKVGLVVHLGSQC